MPRSRVTRIEDILLSSLQHTVWSGLYTYGAVVLSWKAFGKQQHQYNTNAAYTVAGWLSYSVLQPGGNQDTWVCMFDAGRLSLQNCLEC